MASKIIKINDIEYHAVRIIYHADVVRGKIADKCTWWPADKANSLDLADIAVTGLHLAFDTL